MAKHPAPGVSDSVSEPESPHAVTKPRKRKLDLRIHRSTARILLCSLVVCTFAFTFAFTKAWGEVVDRLESLSSTDVFKTMDLKTLDGGRLTAEDLKKTKLTIVNVWGTSCAPCIAEMPELEKVSQEYAADIQVIGIADDIVTADAEPIPEKIDEARTILSKAGATFPNVIPDMNTYTFVKATIIGTPTTFFVNQNGEIIETLTGRQSYKEWKNAIETQLLKLK